MVSHLHNSLSHISRQKGWDLNHTVLANKANLINALKVSPVSNSQAN